MNKVVDISESYSKLVTDYGSPLYVYNLDKVEQRITELRQFLPLNSHIYYSLKPNPLPTIARAAVEHHCRLEVTSENELEVAVKTGINPENILFSGPGKTEAEIRKSLQANACFFSVEGWTDLNRVDKIAKEIKKNVRVLLRVNPEQSLRSGLSMSGLPTQFGFEESDLIDHWSKLSELSEHTTVQGFHIYYGSQVPDATTLAQSFQLGIECVERICAKHNFEPSVLDLGGGFPWAYARVQEETTIENLHNIIDSAIENRQYTKNAELWFESGRYICASSGTLVSSILEIKQSKNESRFVILDAGINHLGGMTGLGRIPRDYTSISSKQNRRVASDQIDELQEVTVVGPLCSPLDCMARKAQLPLDLQPGDLIMVPNVGAYGLTASLVAFLTKPPPIEISLKNGHVIAVEQLNHLSHNRLSVN